MLRALERFLLPNACICCGALVSQQVPDDLVCGVCTSRMRQVGVGCQRCAHPLPPVGPCRFCTGWSDSLIEIRSAVWLNDEARTIVHHLKYGHAQRLAQLVADVMVNMLPRPRAKTVIPVPVAHHRFRERGYNQASLIGARLAERWGMAFLPGALRRVKQARSQTTLTPEGRVANVSSAFEARPVRTTGVGKGTALVVDDVLTTGATVDACARALNLAGWETIRSMTFARAKTYQHRAVGY